MQKEKKHKWGLKGNMYMNTVKTEKNRYYSLCALY